MFKGMLAVTLAIAAVMGYAYWFNDQRIHERAPLPMSTLASIGEDKAEQMSAQFSRDERLARKRSRGRYEKDLRGDTSLA